MTLNWIRETDWENCLTGDLREIAIICGIDVLIKLWECFGKTNVYFSEKPLVELKVKYILDNKDKTVKELSRKLEVSEMFVYNTRKAVQN